MISLFDTVLEAQLSRIPGPGDPDLWHRVADSQLAGPYLVGYARLQQAAGLLARRRRREAADALRDAEAGARRLGATAMSDEIAALARHGRSDGLSNAEIARTLYISEKTASVHVSNILRKLGVTSRVQAATAIHGSGGRKA